MTKPTLPLSVSVPGIDGLTMIDGVLCFRGIPITQMKAWPVHLAARVAGVSGRTFEREIARGNLKASAHSTVSAVELDRYLAARVV